MNLPPLPEPLPHPVIDSHCHLDSAFEVSGLDPAEAIEQAAQALGLSESAVRKARGKLGMIRRPPALVGRGHRIRRGK